MSAASKLLILAGVGIGAYSVYRLAQQQASNGSSPVLPPVSVVPGIPPADAQTATDLWNEVYNWIPFVGAGMSTQAPQSSGGSLQDLAASIASQFGIPTSLFLAQIRRESSWNPNARGTSGEIGLGQLMPGTATQMGVTNPFDPVQNLTGAAKYMSQLYRQFGSWSTALAAYNAGPGNVSKGIIPASTKSYVAQILCWAGLGAC